MSASITIKIPVWLDLICACPILLYRWWKYGYSYRRIYLGEGKFALVDQADYYWLKKYVWFVAGNGKELYAFRNDLIAPGKTKLVSMHRQIMGFPQGFLVDHQNNLPLDNRRANLRLATHSENAYNRPKIRSKTSSKYIGVYFEKATGKYTVKIRVNGIRLWLGRFTSELDAARAYDDAALKYHGQFARLNFPENN